MLTILLVRRYTRIKEDAALGIVLSVFFGAGVAILGIDQQAQGGYAAGLEASSRQDGLDGAGRCPLDRRGQRDLYRLSRVAVQGADAFCVSTNRLRLQPATPSSGSTYC